MQRDDGHIGEDMTSVGAGGIAAIGVNQLGEPTTDTFGEPPKKNTIKSLKKRLKKLKDKNVI